MTDSRAELFRRQARYGDAESPLYAELWRRCADEPLAGEIVGEKPSWDTPLRLLAGVHYLVLAGLAPELAHAYAGEGDPWPPFREALAEHADWLARFVAEQGVQTNEVQRCYALLPGFLTVAREAACGRRLDLIELGPSAGLNLLWDRYGYCYRAGTWGAPEAELVLEGDERGAVPAALLAVDAAVRGRVGVDLDPVDVTTQHGARLLEAFVWADQGKRRERLRQAIAVLRREPPLLLQGDYVELLPDLLAGRDGSALTVVFQTASTPYLTREARATLRETIEVGGAEGPLAWLSTRTRDEEDEEQQGYSLELRLWPGGEPRVVARFDFHGRWLDWRG